MSIKYRVCTPSNYNDIVEEFDSFEEAKRVAKQGYGDVEVILYLVQDNRQLDISEDLQALRDTYVNNF